MSNSPKKDYKYKYNELIRGIPVKLFHKYLEIPVSVLSKFPIENNPKDLISDFLHTNVPDSINDEFFNLSSLLEKRYSEITLNSPLNFKIESSTSYFLYCFIRLSKPLNVLETGVANGHSSFIILSALSKNGNGRLYSIDRTYNVGSLITDELKKNWQLIVLNNSTKKALNALLKSLPRLDVFIHDSNHYYYWQFLEYELAMKYINKSKYIMSDDVNSSYAFLDFCKKYKLNPVLMYDLRKIFGIAKID